ncbi:hypothetical protein [Anaerovorax sp. IOR16]|uniref:hypothetical protein n=1 Tax=Anaerovorax sp. IOR16 TaxID=2773458 RepID=UPI0019D28B01|nr:hypothetical protein [Anaerovorax sp. IOR16]
MERLNERIENLKKGIAQTSGPEEIKVCKGFLSSVLTYMEELSQLKQEIDSGLRPLLPCKPGELIYFIGPDCENCNAVTGLDCFPRCKKGEVVLSEPFIPVEHLVGLESDDGLYATKEAAEAALKERDTQ